MLSPRVVHFLEQEVIWECREATWCECGRVSDDFKGTFLVEPISTSAHQSFAYRRKARFQESLLTSQTVERLKNLWMEIVNEHSRKNLPLGLMSSLLLLDWLRRCSLDENATIMQDCGTIH
jgi:hypothetical protein